MKKQSEKESKPFMNNFASENLSNNEIASGNFSQNTLVRFDGILNGLEKAVALFIPSMRNAFVERYRAETFLKIGLKAQDITKELDIEINPVPPKASLPLFEKMSLEHEEYMHDIWAKLLVSTSERYNPIQIQYAEILSKIGSQEAKILKEIYNYQKGEKHLYSDIEDEMKDYNEKCIIADAANDIYENMEVGELFEDEGKYTLNKNSNTPEIYINVPYPENVSLYDRLYLFDFTICEETGLDLLEKLNLIKKYIDSGDICLVLTDYGYDFVNSLEKYN